MNGELGIGTPETFPRQVMHSKFGEIARVYPYATTGYPADSSSGKGASRVKRCGLFSSRNWLKHLLVGTPRPETLAKLWAGTRKQRLYSAGHEPLHRHTDVDGICVLIATNIRFLIGLHRPLGFCTGACCLLRDVHQDG